MRSVQKQDNTVAVVMSDSFLCLCRYCGYVYISTRICRCPDCGFGNIYSIPINNDDRMNMNWLKKNGFPYIDDRLVNVGVE